jgi:tetratricopeptide (TPR) repeat protein
MPLRRWSAALAAAVTVAAGGTWWNTHRLEAMERATVTAAVAATSAERDVRNADVAFYEARAAQDTTSAADRTQLAALYLQRARETNDDQDYVRAEEAARASLDLRTQRNGAAFAVLASALLAQHRFAEAHEAARQLVAAEPQVGAYRALLGETCLELGDYAGARAAFDSIHGPARQSLAVAPRLARWAEIRGDTAQARLIVRRIQAEADRLRDLPREQAAWFHLRTADLELRQGRPRLAERALRAGLTIHPGDHRLLAAMARLAAVRHDWEDAIQYGDSAIAIALDPATLGIVSDAYLARGDTARPPSTSRRWRPPSGRSRARTTGPGACSCSTTGGACPRCSPRRRRSSPAAATSTATTSWRGRSTGAAARTRPAARWPARSRRARRTRCSCTTPG